MLISSFVTFGADLYIIGNDVNGKRWKLSEPDAKMEETSTGVYEWTGTKLGTEFKINDGAWDNEFNIGASGKDPIIIGKEYYYTNGTDSNLEFLDIDLVENPHVILNTNSGTLMVTGTPVILDEPKAELYVIGENVNGKNWKLSAPDTKMEYIGHGKYEWHGEFLASDFKIHDDQWGERYGYNIGANGDPLKLGESYPFVNQTDDNILIYNASAITNPHIIIDLEEGSLLVEGSPTEYSGFDHNNVGDLYVIGDNINGHHWLLKDPSAKFTYKGDGIYEWTGAYMNSGFKINNGSWGNDSEEICLNFGADKEGTGLFLGEPYKLYASSTSGNISIVGMPEIINPHIKLNMVDRTIVITVNGNTLTVNLPQNEIGYDNCTLELIDNESETNSKILTTTRLRYTFQALHSGKDYTLNLLSPDGTLIGSIDHYIMPENDVELNFDKITPLYNVLASVQTQDGSDVSSGITFEWYKVSENGVETFLKQAPKLQAIPEGQTLLCKLNLDKTLGTQYIIPDDKIIQVNKETLVCDFALQKFKEIILTGKITDEGNNPVANATVTGSILVNKKYHKNFSSRTNPDGRWEISTINSPETTLIFSASGFISEENEIKDYGQENNKIDMGTKVLKKISGPTIEYTLNYKDAYSQELESPYSDYRNVMINVFNVTQNRPHKQISNQYPLLVILDDEVHAGDELELTILSKTGVFEQFQQKVTLSNNLSGTASFLIQGKGGLKASYSSTDNKNNVCLLYSSNGEFLDKQSYINASSTFTNLEEGDYILISMGKPDFINYFSRVSGFDEIGMIKGRDYIVNKFSIHKGTITELHNETIPSLNESRFFYTLPSSYFSVNKATTTTGNYLTFSSAIQFKDEYKDNVQNVKMIFDLPETTEFIENSIIHDSKPLPYQINNNRLVVDLGKNYEDPLRFCAMPTSQGQYSVSAYISFIYNGNIITQPIGSANSSVKDISIISPSIISENEITVHGNANANSKVKVFWDDVMMGSTSVNAIGEWDLHIELNNMKPYTMHNLYAIIETEKGSILTSETKTVLYDNDVPRVFGVEMINQAHRYGHIAPEITYFDYVGNYRPRPYWYMPGYPSFTFRAVIKKGIQSEVTDLTIFALTERGDWVSMPAKYNKEQDKWIACHDFNYGNLPVNVGVSFNYISNEISPERIARQFIDTHTYAMLNKSDFGSIDFNWEENNSSIKFLYDNSYSTGIRINNVTPVDKHGTKIDFIDDGMPSVLTTTTKGVNTLPTNCEEYKLNKIYSYYTSQLLDTNDRSLSMFFPIDLIKAILATEAADKEDTFDFLRTLLNDYSSSKYVEVAYTQEGEKRNGRAKCSLCDEADFNCPDFSAITERLRRKEEHSREINDRIDGFQNVLDWVGHLGDLIGGEGGFLISGVAGLTNLTAELGQGIGNFAINASNNEDFAALRAAGCISDDSNFPTYPSQCGNCGYASDPSGYVYEAVPSNRIEGAQASIYHKVQKENLYGDITEEVVLWNPEEYGQENPLFTDKNGIYQWDVPKGFWQVKIEKEGYQPTYSEWLPVPPPQLDVNLSVVSLKEPEIETVYAYPSGVEIEFNKYMDLSTLTTGNVVVTCDGEDILGEIIPLNAESPDESDTIKYASRIKFVPIDNLTSDKKSVRLLINSNVRTYAGIKMGSSYCEDIIVSPEVLALYADDTKVLYESEKQVTVSVLPPEAAVGKTLHVDSSADMIASISQDPIIINKEGKAIFTVKGELPGMALLTLSIDDVTVQGECKIKVVNSIITPEPPIASRASGTEVYKGTEIILSTDTENGVIYYTLDGSCPCEDSVSRFRYGAPIIINEDTKILAITISGSDADESSEVMEFTYKLKRNEQNFGLKKGWNWVSHGMADSISARIFFENESIESITGQNSSIRKNDWNSDVKPSFNLSPIELYKIETSEDISSINYEGYTINPIKSFLLNTGYNWIGYPFTKPMRPADVLTGCCNKDFIIGQEGFSQYDGSKWIGTLDVLSPGKGYIYYSDSSNEISFKMISSSDNTSYSLSSKANNLNKNIYKYPNILPMIFSVVDEDQKIPESPFIVKAISGEELRGIGVIENGIGFLSIYGTDEEKIEIIVTEENKDTSCTRLINFNSDSPLGTLDSPYIISINNHSSSIDCIDGYKDLNIYTIDGKLFVSGLPEGVIGLIEIVDLEGISILSKKISSGEILDIEHLTKGVYFIRLKTSETTYSKKLLLM